MWSYITEGGEINDEIRRWVKFDIIQALNNTK